MAIGVFTRLAMGVNLFATTLPQDRTVSLQPSQLSAAEAARRIARGELTSEALVHACLERIAAREGDVRAWEFLDPDKALEQARAADRETPRGPLHGVPVGIKDVIDTDDQPTTYGSPIYRDHRTRWDASCVALLRRAGCVILGKTVTTEFANNHPGKTRNPRNTAHTPGGSSSGSAAAVADHMVPLALGTQTGGSTIRPAAYCGAVGFKPTFNLINRAGIKPVAESLDTVGLFARSPEDIALLLNVLTDVEMPSEGRQAGRRPRIGLLRTSQWRAADAATREAIEHAAVLLAEAGAAVSDCHWRDDAALGEAQLRIMGYESARALAWEQANHAAALSDALRPRLAEGWALPRKDYEAALRLAREARVRYAGRMQDCDFLLTPAASGEAPAGLAATGSSQFARIWTLLGVPCISLPFGTGPLGLPLAIQLVGRRGADRDLLAWADWVASRLGPG